ncbi:MAG: response regulator [Desulfobacterales bacterium]|nr:response regulator [Desulfobacterales bacterium]
MKTILIVDDDEHILRLATEAIKSYGEGYRVKTALNGKEAAEFLKISHVDLVITDIKMPVMDGYELMAYMNNHYRDIPVFVITGYGSPDVAEQLKQDGVYQYIEKPFDLNVLREKIFDLFGHSPQGYIHSFTLANFLQVVELEEKSITLCVSSKGRAGFLHFESGELIDADANVSGNQIKGENAAFEILCWEDAEIEILGIQKRERTIHAPLMNVLHEAYMIQDEKNKHRLSPEELLEEAVSLAEGHNFKDARELIVTFLKHTKKRDKHKGWLWYSRIIATMKSIDASLKKAARIAPEDPELIEEIKKFYLAASKITSDRVRRCPFCWAPVETKEVQCTYCRAHMIIHNQFFSSARDADRQIINQAIERYVRVIGKGKNVDAYYYMGIAHLNLENWEEALDLFHKAINLAPGRRFFSDQLNIMLNYMASKEAEFEGQAETEEKEQYVGKRKKILIAEDSDTTRKVISIRLAEAGYEIIEAKDGLDALSKLNEERPDLILLDIVLPKMDGYKTLKIIKENSDFRNIPIIVLTVKDSLMSKLKGKMAGITEYMTKPFELDNLVETIEKHIAAGIKAGEKKNPKNENNPDSSMNSQKIITVKAAPNEILSKFGKAAFVISDNVKNNNFVINELGKEMIGVLKNNPGKNEELTDYVKQVIKKSSMVSQDIEKLRNIILSGKISLRMLNMNGLLEEVLSLMNMSRVSVEKDLNADVPRITGDREMLMQMAGSFIQNSVEAMPDGGNLKVRTGLKKDFVELEFADTGTGITKENMDRIFDLRFTTKKQEYGLGLYLSNEIIKTHKGSIEFSSALNTGTAFTVCLPIQDEWH